MLDQRCLRNLADGLTSDNNLAASNERLEGPAFRGVERINLFAAPNPCAAAGLNPRQGTLNAVIDVADQSRPKPNGQWRAGTPDRSAGLEHRGVFIDLDGRAVADQSNDFADQTEFADLHNLVHLRAEQTDRSDGRAADASDDGLSSAHLNAWWLELEL